MLDNIEVLCHSSIRINKEKIVYIDPFKIEKNYNDANIIFVTHDHYSQEDIDKVKKDDTVIAVPTHYGSIVGKNQDAKEFIKLLHPMTKGIILIK